MARRNAACEMMARRNAAASMLPRRQQNESCNAALPLQSISYDKLFVRSILWWSIDPILCPESVMLKTESVRNDFALTPQMESYIVHIILFTRLRVQRDWVSARAVPRGGTEHHWRNLSCLSVFDPHLAQTCRHTPWRRGTRHTVQPHTRSPLWLVCPRWAGAHCPAWKLHQHVARCNSMLCIAWQCVILRVTLWNGCLVIVRL